MLKLLVVSLIMIMPGLWPPDAIAAAATAGAEAPKRRIERERQLLYRSVEDLNRTQEYAQAAFGELEKQITAVDILEPASRERDLRSLRDWYQSYGDWISGVLTDLEADLALSYSDEQTGIVRPERYSALIDGYARQGARLADVVTGLERLNDRTVQRIAGLKLIVEFIASAAFAAERDREKKQLPRGKDRGGDRSAYELYERYRDVTEVELAMMQRELITLGDLERHYGVLIELGRLELFWISVRTGDWEALSRLARVIGGEGTAPIAEAGNRVIKTYESGILSFKRKIDDISRARARIAPSGSLRTLDRAEELSDSYDLMKHRYEQHISWLATQAGAYRADLAELKSGK